MEDFLVLSAERLLRQRGCESRGFGFSEDFSALSNGARSGSCFVVLQESRLRVPGKVMGPRGWESSVGSREAPATRPLEGLSFE